MASACELCDDAEDLEVQTEFVIKGDSKGRSGVACIECKKLLCCECILRLDPLAEFPCPYCRSPFQSHANIPTTIVDWRRTEVTARNEQEETYAVLYNQVAPTMMQATPDVVAAATLAVHAIEEDLPPHGHTPEYLFAVASSFDTQFNMIIQGLYRPADTTADDSAADAEDD